MVLAVGRALRSSDMDRYPTMVTGNCLRSVVVQVPLRPILTKYCTSCTDTCFYATNTHQIYHCEGHTAWHSPSLVGVCVQVAALWPGCNLNSPSTRKTGWRHGSVFFMYTNKLAHQHGIAHPYNEKWQCSIFEHSIFVSHNIVICVLEFAGYFFQTVTFRGVAWRRCMRHPSGFQWSTHTHGMFRLVCHWQWFPWRHFWWIVWEIGNLTYLVGISKWKTISLLRRTGAILLPGRYVEI